MQNNVLNLPAKRVDLIVFFLLSLYPLVGMGVDLIAPSLPAISHSLQVSSSIAKNLITAYLFGNALGSLLVGFLSDALGRRKFIVGGFLMFVMASLVPTIFPNIIVLLFARFLQGLAIASFAVVARAIFSDMLAPERLTRIATLISTTWGIGPIIGPVIGGYLQYYFNWQACFYFFAILGCMGLLGLYWFVPETHLERQPLNFQQIKSNFVTIITHRIFIGSVMLMGVTYSLLIAFNTLGPFLIQTELGKSSVYFGHLALFLGLMFLLGTVTCRRLLKRYQPKQILFFSTITFLLIALAGLSLAYFNSKAIWVIIVPTLLLFFGTGIIYPASMGKGLTLFRHLAGSGSAVMTSINLLLTSITALLMGLFYADSAIPLAWICLVLMVLSGLIFYFCLRR